ncbi:putative nuclease HARBI1 [Uloborus diversus]|uniref:putative nuclease HARBI1 n=1 Tax=Uloborus diversus TaxID=327109 RepID=UPI00240923FC|nr:putative nuclease HARBI1 [Uloborus diversus]XP_054709872.1 putative nuclease HARBI1 [Uloborus diversus]
MADEYDLFALEDLEILEMIERRPRTRPNRQSNDLYDKDEVDFRKRYRFNKETVYHLISTLHLELESETTRNDALSAAEKILAALRFYATGTIQLNIGDLNKISQPSACNAINEVSKSLASLSGQYIYLPQTEEERLQVSQKFFEKFGFPSVIGALDCTLIRIKSPGGERAETYRSRRGKFSLNVQTVSDADLLIRNLVVRWPGSTHDSTIFDHSYLRAHLETEVPNRYHVLGDLGYPLRSYLMTPFSAPATDGEKRYNEAQILARNVVERQYGVWKKRFACIAESMRCQLQNSQTIIVATAVLHNIAIILGDSYDEGNFAPGVHDGPVNHNTHHAGVAKRNAIVANYF